MPWVVAGLGGLPAGATVLDLACGAGRHARYAAGRGLAVLAVDRDADALALLRVRTRSLANPPDTRLLDLEAEVWPLAGLQFDAVIVSNYLHRARLDDTAALVAPGGRLIYATFARGNERYGRPRNPDFLLAEGELLDLARRCGLVVTAYESGHVEAPAPAVVQRLIAWRTGDAAHRPKLCAGGRAVG